MGKSDGSESYRFGPFVAKGPNVVTHLGLLEDYNLDKAAQMKWEDLVVIPSAEIVLPRLEFPPHGVQGNADAEEEAGDGEGEEVHAEPPRKGERCTCFDEEH